MNKKQCRDRDNRILSDIWEGKIPRNVGNKWQYFFDTYKNRIYNE